MSWTVLLNMMEMAIAAGMSFIGGTAQFIVFGLVLGYLYKK